MTLTPPTSFLFPLPLGEGQGEGLLQGESNAEAETPA